MGAKSNTFLIGTLGFGLVLALVLFRGPQEAAGSGRTKQNLDLPFDAFGSSQSEEGAPDIIFFHGGSYEAGAIVFCLDESKSMKNGLWEAQQKETFRALGDLSPKTEFNIVFYGATAYSMTPKLMRATDTNKARARGFVSSRQLTLGTCLGPAIRKSLALLKQSQSSRRTLVVAGDGAPTDCPYGSGVSKAIIMQRILNETQGGNPGGKVKVHTILMGEKNEKVQNFMQDLARTNRGSFRKVSQR